MKRFILFFAGMAVSWAGYSQNTVVTSGNDTAKVKLWTIYPGYIVTHENDTLRGYVMLKNLVDNQDRVFFYKSPGQDKKEAIKYKPKDLKAYKVGPRVYEAYKFKPSASTYAGNDAKAWHFILRTIDGPFTLYRWYYETIERSEQRVKVDKEHPERTQIDLSFNEDDLRHITLGKKLSGELIDFDSFKMLTGFKKQMSKLVSDYPELAKKIAGKAGGYRITDLEKIVKEYNAWYEKQHPDWKKSLIQ